MFANIFLLSLLTIIYGTKGDEGGGGNAVERNAMNFLPDLPQQQHASDGEKLFYHPWSSLLLCFFWLTLLSVFDLVSLRGNNFSYFSLPFRFKFYEIFDGSEGDKNAI